MNRIAIGICAALCFSLVACGGPGSVNPGEGQAPSLAAVTFSPPGGTYYIDQLVSLSAPAGAVIRYTIDDPDISRSSPIYYGGIPIIGFGTSATIRALASLEGYADSPVASATFAISLGWEGVGSEGFNGQGVSYLDIAIAPDGTPFAAYNSTSDIGSNTLGQLFVASYSDGNWNAVGSALSLGGAIQPKLAFDANGVCHVAFIDTGDSSKAVVKALGSDGQTWTALGPASMPSITGWHIDLAFAPGGLIPHVFLGFGGRVAAYSNGAWSVVGGSTVVSSGVGYPEEGVVAFDSEGVLYAAYVASNTGKATVKKFSEGAWTIVGTEGFTPDEASCISMAVDPTGAPCLSFKDFTSNERYASMMRFDGTDWSFVGGQGFTPGHVYETDLVFDPLTGEPIVGIIDNYAEVSVMRYSGGAWSMEGAESFSDAYGENAYSLRIAVDGAGRIYAAYQDWDAGCGITVMRRLP